MKKIVWHAHAKARLVERGIGLKLIRDALDYPDQIISEGKYSIIHKFYGDFNRKKKYLLRIFVEEQERKFIIRSVYRTSKIHKYWRDTK